jgi:hypothetical protein
MSNLRPEDLLKVMPLLGWPIPDDFEKEESVMLFEMCMQQQLSYTEAVDAIRLLRTKH